MKRNNSRQRTVSKKVDQGKIRRLKGGKTEISVVGYTDVAKIDGVICDNPKASENERIYRKIFCKKPIYFPHEYERARREVLGGGKDIVVYGMNGYTYLPLSKCQAYGVKPGAYRALCGKILSSIILSSEKEYEGIDVRLADGACNYEIDGAIIDVARALNKKHLGHSCPRFMFWVEDNDDPVYVASTQQGYSDSFIDSLDILVSANGRIQAFQHDISAAFMKRKHVIPINILKSISTTGGPPAFNPDGSIEDAVAAMEALLHPLVLQMGLAGHRRVDELIKHVQDVTTDICMQLISPERAFAWK